jgi:hypothetical protein
MVHAYTLNAKSHNLIILRHPISVDHSMVYRSLYSLQKVHQRRNRNRPKHDDGNNWEIPLHTGAPVSHFLPPMAFPPGQTYIIAVPPALDQCEDHCAGARSTVAARAVAYCRSLKWRIGGCWNRERATENRIGERGKGAIFEDAYAGTKENCGCAGVR